MMKVALRHAFPGFTLDAAFNAPAGVTAIFGRSGSGKTTLVNAIAGLLTPDAGRIEVAGRVLFDSKARLNTPTRKRRIGYVFQDARLFPHMTVRRNLTYGTRFAPRDEPGADFGALVEMLGIGHLLDRRPATLSGGERSRVGMGRALLAKPHLLILDEPMAALDEERRAEILPYLERLRDTDIPMLYISHSMAEVTRLATTLVLLDQGRVVKSGPLEGVLSAGLDRAEAGTILQARATGREDGLTRAETPAGALLLPLEATPGARLALRIRAQDVMLSLDPPGRVSALNVLAATVMRLEPDGPHVMVHLRAGQAELLARVTARSAHGLGLAPGVALWAVVKSVALA